MGKTVDLPDTLDATSLLNGASLDGDSGGAPGADADDILSQLAGDEIDRLLAEADVEKGPDGSSVPAELTKDAPASKREAFETPISDPAAASASTNRPADTKAIDVQPDNVSHNSAVLSSPFAIAADAQPIDVTALSAAQSESANAIVATPAASRVAVAFSTAVDAEMLPSIDTTHALSSEENWPDDERPLPILLRPLAWLNAPFDALPDTAREMLGKVAILTIFNAVAVLVYVLVFRR